MESLSARAKGAVVESTLKPSQLVPSVLRAIRIIEYLSELSEPAGITKLSSELKIPKSTAHAITNTLVSLGYINRTANSNYHMAPKILSLAQRYADRVDPHKLFETEADKIPELSGESVVHAVLDGSYVVYVNARRGTQPVAIGYEIGTRLPANCTSSGKALLSGLNTEDVYDLYKNKDFPTLTKRSINDYDLLVNELLRIKDDGYAIDDEETALGMFCISALVHSKNGKANSAVSVAVMKATLTTSRLLDLKTGIMRLARKLSAYSGE